MAIANTTIARPYAKAIFSLAQKQKNEQAWLQFLTQLKEIFSNPFMMDVIKHPKMTPVDLMQLMEKIVGSLSTEQRNLLQILFEAKRLAVVPEIQVLYAEFWRAFQQIQTVEIYSAFDLSEAEKQALQQSLEHHLKHKIIVEYSSDKNLIGGVVIKAGDLMIDHSVRGMVQHLSQTLST